MHQRGGPVAFDRPGEGEGGGGDGDHRWHEDGGGAVGNARNRRFAALCFGERRHHVAEECLAAELFGAIDEAAVADQRTCQHAAAGFFRLWPRFAGQVAFVRPAAAACDDAVGGDAFAGGGAQQVADLHLVKRHGLPSAVALHAHLARRQFEQEAEAVQAGFFAAVLKVFAERDEADDHYPRFKVDVAVAVRRAHHVERVEVDGAGAEGDEHVHVGQSPLDARPGAFVEGDGEPELDDAGEGELRHGRQHPVVAANHHAHHADEKRQVDGEQQPQPPAGMRRFVGGRSVLRQAGAVTGLGNERDERRRVGLAVVVGDLCFFAGEIDAGGGDEGLFVEDFFDAAGAGLAGHAVDVVADFLLHGDFSQRESPPPSQGAPAPAAGEGRGGGGGGGGVSVRDFSAGFGNVSEFLPKPPPSVARHHDSSIAVHNSRDFAGKQFFGGHSAVAWRVVHRPVQ